MPTETAAASPTPTDTRVATVTPLGDLVVHGQVFDADVGPSRGISEALVSAVMCVRRAFQTWSGLDGRYELWLPGLYLNQCVSITLEANAVGYQSLTQLVPVSDLRAQPQRDLPLVPLLAPTATLTATTTPTPTVTQMPLSHALLPLIWRAAGAGSASPRGVRRLGDFW